MSCSHYKSRLDGSFHRVAVANGGSHELLVFDAQGNHLDSWGGEGEGPGHATNHNECRRSFSRVKTAARLPKRRYLAEQ